MSIIVVRPAVFCDLKYIDSLQRKNAEQLSFYPMTVFEREIQFGRVVLAELNQDPCGYIYHGAFGHGLKIHQACIQYDLRGQLYGAQLVQHIVKLARASDCRFITLRCGSDIEANGFWRAMGFVCEAVTAGGVRRLRDINNWKLLLQPELFSFLVEPSTKAQNSSLWRRNKGENQSQFMRGKQLLQYRKSLEEKDGLNDN
jgi:GNAT superfamily N-acetyltransferase